MALAIAASLIADDTQTMLKRRELDFRLVLWTTRELIRRIDAWRARIPGGLSRAAAIRRFIKVGLEYHLMWAGRGPGPSEDAAAPGGPHAPGIDTP